MKPEIVSEITGIVVNNFTTTPKGTKPEHWEGKVLIAIGEKLGGKLPDAEWHWPQVLDATFISMVGEHTGDKYTGMETLTTFFKNKGYFNYFHNTLEGNVNLGGNSLEFICMTGQIIMVLHDQSQLKCLNSTKKFVGNITNKYECWTEKISNEKQNYENPESKISKMITAALFAITGTIKHWNPEEANWKPAIQEMLNVVATNDEHFYTFKTCWNNIPAFRSWLYNHAGDITVKDETVNAVVYCFMQAHNNTIGPVGLYNKGKDWFLKFFNEKFKEYSFETSAGEIITKTMISHMYEKTEEFVTTTPGPALEKSYKKVTVKDISLTKNQLVTNVKNYKKVLIDWDLYDSKFTTHFTKKESRELV